MPPSLVQNFVIAWCATSVWQAAMAAAPAERDYECLIEARQTLEIRSSVEGLIESIPVKRGDLVKKNTLLAKLSSGQERAVLDLARSRAAMEGELKAAQAQLDIAKKKWERAVELKKKNFVSESAKEEAEAEYRLATERMRTARDNRKLAELEVKRAEEVLAQRSILSPVSGVVAHVKLGPGELASSNQRDPIMVILEVDPLNVEVILPVSELGKVKNKQKALVIPEEPVGGRYSATVETVDANLDSTSGTFGVRLTLPNPGNRIPAGAKCRVRF